MVCNEAVTNNGFMFASNSKQKMLILEYFTFTSGHGDFRCDLLKIVAR